MMIRNSVIALAFFLIITGCSSTNVTVTSEVIITWTPSPVHTATKILTPTSSPTLEPTVSPTSSLTPEPTVSPEAKAAWERLALKTADQWQITKIEGWGMGWRNTETGAEIVELPITFSNNAGDETVVHQLCYKTQTTGEGVLTELACMGGHKDQQRLMVIDGTDEKAKEWFAWMANYPAVQDNNPQLLQAFRDAAEGKKKFVIVHGDINPVPEVYRTSADYAINSGLKIEGMKAGVQRQHNVALKNPHSLIVMPFTRGDMVVALLYYDIQSFTDPSHYKWYKDKTANGSTRRGTIMILQSVFYLSAEGNFPVNMFSYETGELGKFENDLHTYFRSEGLVQMMEILE